MPRAMRRLPAAFVAFVALVAAPAALAGHAPGCDANRPAGDHMNVYSNMLAVVGEAQSLRDRSNDCYQRAKASRDALSERRASLEDLSSRYQALDGRLEQILVNVGRLESSDSFRDTIATVEKARDEAKELAVRADALLRGDGEGTKDPATVKREAERARGDFQELAVSLQKKLDEAGRIWLEGGYRRKWGCVEQLNARFVKPWKSELEANQENLPKMEGEIVGLAADVETLRTNVETKRRSVENYPGKIARDLGNRSVTTMDGLLDFLKDRAAPQAKVVFRDHGEVVPDGIVSIRRATADDAGAPLDRPQDPSPRDDGVAFLWWRERNSGAEFSAWGQPVRRERLELDAVWGYRVRVAGITNVFAVVKEDQSSPTFSAVFADPDFVDFQERMRDAAQPGEAFAGWCLADTGTGESVDRQTPIRRSCLIKPWYRPAVYTVTWCNADGTILATEEVGYGETLRRRDLPRVPPEYEYLHWSDARDGEAWEGWGSELRGDLKLFAVRERKHRVDLVLPDRTTFATLGFLNGEEFSPSAADVPPEPPGERFLGWFSGKDDFAGGKVYGDMRLEAHFRKEEFPEFVERSFRPWQGRFPLPLLAGADVALLVILVALCVTGASPRKPRPKKEGRPKRKEGADPANGADAGNAASADAGKAADAGSDGAGAAAQ